MYNIVELISRQNTSASKSANGIMQNYWITQKLCCRRKLLVPKCNTMVYYDITDVDTSIIKSPLV